MIENGKRDFEEDEVSPSDGENVHAHVNNEDGGSHESKKPRKAYQHSHAKVKTGCNTCKTRRVICDESKPGCMKCQRLGRVCDGYPAFNERWKPENQMIAVSASVLPIYQENSNPEALHLSRNIDHVLQNDLMKRSFPPPEEAWYEWESPLTKLPSIDELPEGFPMHDSPPPVPLVNSSSWESTHTTQDGAPFTSQNAKVTGFETSESTSSYYNVSRIETPLQETSNLYDISLDIFSDSWMPFPKKEIPQYDLSQSSKGDTRWDSIISEPKVGKFVPRRDRQAYEREHVKVDEENISSSLNTANIVKKPIPPEKFKRALALYSEFRMEEDRACSSSTPGNDSMLNESPFFDKTSDYSSVASLDSSSIASVISRPGSAQSDVTSRRRSRRTLRTAKRTALIRYLGACQNCRIRYIRCSLDHHDLEAVEMAYQNASLDGKSTNHREEKSISKWFMEHIDNNQDFEKSDDTISDDKTALNPTYYSNIPAFTSGPGSLSDTLLQDHQPFDRSNNSTMLTNKECEIGSPNVPPIDTEESDSNIWKYNDFITQPRPHAISSGNRFNNIEYLDNSMMNRQNPLVDTTNELEMYSSDGPLPTTSQGPDIPEMVQNSQERLSFFEQFSGILELPKDYNFLPPPPSKPVMLRRSEMEHNRRFSTELKGHQNTNDWNIQSIISINTYRDSGLGSSLPSQGSDSITQELPQAAKEEILTIIRTDSEFQLSLSNIASKISKPRFIRNIRRLLQFFNLDLRKTAIDTREKDAVNILERHTLWFATRLFDFSNPNRDSDSLTMASYLDQQIDKRLLLEQYLASSLGTKLCKAQMGDEAEKIDTSAMEVDDLIDIDYSNFPNVEHIKKFISGGSAFEVLRLNTSQFARNELPDPSSENTRLHIDQQTSSHLKTNHISNFQQFRLILAKQARIVLVIQKFLKLMRAHSIVHSYSAVYQAKPGVLEIVSNPSDNNSSNETSEITPDISIATSGDIESDTSGTDYDSDDLPDDPELSASAEERITNPKAYFEKLESLELQMFSNSGLFIHKTGDSTGPAQDEALLCLPKSEHYKYHTDSLLDIIKSSESELLLEFLVCHNRACRAGDNLTILQEHGYCAKHISMLVQDQQRAEVVRVIQIEIQTILDLVEVFKKLMGTLLASFASGSFYNTSTTTDELDRLIKESGDSLNLTQKCIEVLDTISISSSNDMWSRPLNGFVWQVTTQVIELAILSYAGAHIQPFDIELMEKDIPSFHLPQRFKYHDDTLNRFGCPSFSTLGGLGVKICRRQLQCMDRFLGKKQPWVFHPSNHGSPDPKIRLFLSSTIEALTDLWGPSWKIMESSLTNEIKQYDIGNGAIIPWKTREAGNDTHLIPLNSEVFCHWIPFRSWNEDEVEVNQELLPRQYLLSSDILLIGAPTDYGLIVNEKCVPSPERILRIKSRLSDQQALRQPNTSRARRYVDSHAIQIQGSAMGFISGSGQVTYKRRIGHTMKDSLVERWRHGLRNPIDLEAFSGVEVSLCSRNARRRRLLNILASDTMVNYLHAISFTWDKGVCEASYFKALRYPKSFRKFWKAHKDWQSNIGDAISKCFDALEETGIDEDNQELSAFWVESFDAEGDSDGEDDDNSVGQPDSIKDNATGGGIQSVIQNNIANGLPTPPKSLLSLDLDTCKFFEEWVVTLFRSEHTWTGFLEDSEETSTMVVVGKECLDFHDQDGFGRCCFLSAKTKGYSVLQTSLQINESLLSHGSTKLKQEKVDSCKNVWNAHELKRGTTFCLGNHGTLEVISVSSKLCPTVVEWKGVKGGKTVGGILKEVKNVGVNENFLGKGTEKHHKEFIRGCWEVKPLPVLVMSKSTKVRFGKD
ncbi:hypothetical protein BOTCAL_0114g00110 [Botryotinia calthae]|uniref:Zn(2)-C6 fungal-type domain-containing protein n=1 Tax=Botryotinia calthae TaxID=38488 RepID=A0A4Y8D7D3_9HELO|nr:hypothetical protein BOTCAL_0114g00110 [Botryotinia calthae]